MVFNKGVSKLSRIIKGHLIYILTVDDIAKIADH